MVSNAEVEMSANKVSKSDPGIGAYDEADTGSDSSASSSVCLNCGTRLLGGHCHACGQRDSDLRRPIWSLGHELLDDVLSFDSRTVHTILPLLFLPGVMSRRFVDGERARYVPPVRLLLIVLLIFFLVLNISNVALVQIKVSEPAAEAAGDAADRAGEAASGRNLPEQEPTRPQSEIRQELLADPDVQKLPEEARERLISGIEAARAENGPTIGAASDRDVSVQFFVPIDPDTSATLISQEELEELLEEDSVGDDPTERKIKGFVQRVLAGVNRGAENPRRLNQMFNDWIPRAMLILVPLFAVLLRVFYWGKSRYLFNQLIFSLHTHTFLFVLLTALIGIVPVWGGNIGGWVFIIVAPLYLLIAMKQFYKQGWFRTVFKFLVLGFVYFLMLSVVLLTILPFALADI